MQIHPFRALRPRAELVGQVTCVPYDVIDTTEARAMAEGKPDSFLHVIRPEIGLPVHTDIHHDMVYEEGRRQLNRLVESGVLTYEEHPSVYVYRLDWMGQTQTGVFTCVSVDEYDNGLIRRHEMTRPDKEDDRTRHILTQNAHAEPVMLAHQPDMNVASLIHRCTDSVPLYDLTSEDGVRHTLWMSEDIESWVQAFARIPMFYIADGHHRCKAASRVVEELRAKGERTIGEAGYFPAVLFSTDQMQILPYNRMVYHADDAAIARMWDELESLESGSDTPTSRNKVCVYCDGQWRTVKLHVPTDLNDAVKRLDVTLLQEQILNRYFGIGDPRTDQNITFVGGIRGPEALKEFVDSGRARIAISMYPTSIDELIEVSDQQRLMPPKSTWFEPKLRSGFLIHPF
jgi:uncharacterized protein (DUF1015 family)